MFPKAISHSIRLAAKTLATSGRLHTNIQLYSTHPKLLTHKISQFSTFKSREYSSYKDGTNSFSYSNRQTGRTSGQNQQDDTKRSFNKSAAKRQGRQPIGHFGGRSRSQVNRLNVDDNLTVVREGRDSMFITIQDTNSNEGSDTKPKKDYRGNSKKAKTQKINLHLLNKGLSVNRNEAVRIILDMSVEDMNDIDANSSFQNIGGNDIKKNDVFENLLSQTLAMNTSAYKENNLLINDSIKDVNSQHRNMENEKVEFISPKEEKYHNLLSLIYDHRPNSSQVISPSYDLYEFYKNLLQNPIFISTEKNISQEDAEANLADSLTITVQSLRRFLSSDSLIRMMSIFLFRGNIKNALTILNCALHQSFHTDLPLHPSMINKLFAYYSLQHQGASIFELYEILTKSINQTQTLNTENKTPKNHQYKRNSSRNDSSNSSNILSLSSVFLPNQNYSHLVSDYMYNCVIRELCRMHDWRRILNIINVEMPSFGIIPSAAIILQTASLLTQVRTVEEALNFISPYVPQFSRIAKAQFVALFVTSHIKAGNIASGLDILYTFGPSTLLFRDEAYIASIMELLMHNGHLNEAEEMFNKSAKLGRLSAENYAKGTWFEPTMLSFNVLIDGKLSYNDFDGSLKILEKASNHNLTPSLTTMNYFVNYSIRTQQPELAMVVLKYMSKKDYDADFDLMHNLIKLSAIVASKNVSGTGKFPDNHEKAYLQIQDILECMKANNMTLTTTTMEYVIDAYCLIGKYDEATSLCENGSLEKYKITPNESMYAALLRNATHHRKFDDVGKYVNVILNHNVTGHAAKKQRQLLSYILRVAIQHKNKNVAIQTYNGLRRNHKAVFQDIMMYSLISMLQKQNEHKLAQQIQSDMGKKASNQKQL